MADMIVSDDEQTTGPAGEQVVMLEPDFFFKSWHHYDSDNFCPQEQEKAAYEAMKQADQEKHMQKVLEDHQTSAPNPQPMIALRVPAPGKKLGTNKQYPRLHTTVPTGHNYKKECVASMRAVNQLYAKFQADTEFHHKYQVIGSALHPGYVGTILVLCESPDEKHEVPEFYPEEKNHGPMELCEVTYNKSPVDKAFLRIQSTFAHDAQLMIATCLEHGQKLPPRYLWMQRVLQLREAMPKHQETVGNLGKALLRMALCVGDQAGDDSDALELLQLFYH